MSFMTIEDRLKNLKCIYGYMQQVCIFKGDKRYRGAYLDPKWGTFDGFVKDNWIRYYKALIKWKNYKPITTGKLKNSYIRFVRKTKEGGYTKINTVFTSPSDAVKYNDSAHRVMLDENLLGTRDIVNILKKRGIEAKTSTISERLNNGRDIFNPLERGRFKYKGKYISLVQIAEKEKISLGTLKFHLNKKGKGLTQAIDASRGKGMSKIEFEGRIMFKVNAFKILSERSGIHHATIGFRYKKHGLDLEKLLSNNHGNHKHGKYHGGK